jgi:hypothetical protein
MDSREMPFWEGSYGVLNRSLSKRGARLQPQDGLSARNDNCSHDATKVAAHMVEKSVKRRIAAPFESDCRAASNPA